MLTEELEPDVIVFNNELTPSQIRNLSSVLDARVIDRTQLIYFCATCEVERREASSRISSVAIYNAASYGARVVFITSWWWYWNERAR